MGLAAVGLTSAMAVPPAQASFCCEVRKTKDGFLALRSGPGTRFRLLAKVPSGEMVCFGSREDDAPDTGDWIEGWYTGTDGVRHNGWINGRFLLDECG